MSRSRATLLLDPRRRAEQLAFIRERDPSCREVGDQVIANITEGQAAAFAAQQIVVQFQPDSDVIELPAVRFSPASSVPEPPPGLTAAEPVGAQRAYFILQLVAAEEHFLGELAAVGAFVVDDLPGPAAIFRLTAAQAQACRALAFVSWVGIYHPAYALSFELSGRDEPFGPLELASQRVDEAQVPSDPNGNLRAVPFSDRNASDLRAALESAGATIVEDIGHALILNAPAATVRELLKVPGLRALEREIPADLFNQRASIILGVSQVRNVGNVDFLVNLDGSGETVHVFDSGFDNGNGFPFHPDLAGRLVVNNANGVPVTADFNSHGTHVAGSIAGDGAQAIAAGAATIPRGTAPGARLIFSSVNAGLPPAPGVPPGPGAKAPLNFRRFVASAQAAAQAGARVHSGSFGNDNGNRYTNTSAQIDRFCQLNPESVVVLAAGNDERQSSVNGPLEATHLGEWAVPKNILTVGATENETNLEGLGAYAVLGANRFTSPKLAPLNTPAPVGAQQMSDNANHVALFSSRGRVGHADERRQRIKPDLVAPGTNVVSTRRVVLPAAPPPPPPGQVIPPAASAPAAFYGVISGTSMATPLVSGACALVRQFYRQRFGELRRPALLEALTAFVDDPAATPHADGFVLAWPKPNGANTDVAAVRYTRAFDRLGRVVTLAANVGPHPALALATRGTDTFLLYRAADQHLNVMRFDRNLVPVAAFGAAGTLTLAALSRIEDDRRPALNIEGHRVAIAWIEDGTDELRFQRFHADTGAALDAAPLVLGSATNTSPHGYITNTGARFAVMWARLDGGTHHLQLRFVENDGALVGAAPVEALTQPAALSSPQPVFQPRLGEYRACWLSADLHPGGDVMTGAFDANGALTAPGASRAVALAAPSTARKPRLALHPVSGYLLAWEDDSQNARADVYVAFLSDAGALDGRIPADRRRLSDTPAGTRGFALAVEPSGAVVTWQGEDEVNSDVRAAFALKLTVAGAFQAQQAPSVPLLQSGRYVPHQLSSHAELGATAAALSWAGGPYLALALEPRDYGVECRLEHTNADGRQDSSFGAGGQRTLATDVRISGVSLVWTGARTFAAVAGAAGLRVIGVDPRGELDPAFADAGVARVDELLSDRVTPQLGYRGTGADLRVVAAWGQSVPGVAAPTLRVAVFDALGQRAVAPRDLASVGAVADHGWFHFVPSDTPARAIAVWDETVAGQQVLRANRFDLGAAAGGMAQHVPALTLAGPPALPGDSGLGVLAPRPVLFAPPIPTSAVAEQQARQREYGLAFQNRPPGGNWRIVFSRLNRDGTLGAVANVVVIADAAEHATDPQLVWHDSGYGLAWRQQPVGGGPHRLLFAVLDQNGVNAAPAPAQLSSATADVQRFQLTWNGRSFRVIWTEQESAVLRRMQSALALPRDAVPVGFDRPYQHPSSALIRATLINGAANLNLTPLPNAPVVSNDTFNPNDGYGWGRINVRQSLAPAPPVTFHVRDDASVAAHSSVRYEFELPAGSERLRVTLVWTDPPGNTIFNELHLRVTAPPAAGGTSPVYVGNWFGTGDHPCPTVESTALRPGAVSPFQIAHPIEQVILDRPRAGTYVVEVIANSFHATVLQQHPGQPFALVFVASGPEWPLSRPLVAFAAPAPLPVF